MRESLKRDTTGSYTVLTSTTTTPHTQHSTFSRYFTPCFRVLPRNLNSSSVIDMAIPSSVIPWRKGVSCTSPPFQPTLEHASSGNIHLLHKMSEKVGAAVPHAALPRGGGLPKRERVAPHIIHNQRKHPRVHRIHHSFTPFTLDYTMRHRPHTLFDVERRRTTGDVRSSSSLGLASFYPEASARGSTRGRHHSFAERLCLVYHFFSKPFLVLVSEPRPWRFPPSLDDEGLVNCCGFIP